MFLDIFILRASFLTPFSAQAETAAFDLPGPRVEVTVNRAGKTLPIAKVPNLQVGDRLWVHPEFPDSQTAHYLMIVTFLRGSTNPPPEDWLIQRRNLEQEGEERKVFRPRCRKAPSRC